MKSSIIKFIDYKFGDYRMVLHESLEEVYYLAREESFDAVIDKDNKKLYINIKIFDSLNEMFDIGIEDSKNYIRDWAEIRLGIKDCDIRKIHRNR